MWLEGKGLARVEPLPLRLVPSLNHKRLKLFARSMTSRNALFTSGVGYLAKLLKVNSSIIPAS